jgi:hypothetical protein
MPRNRVIFYREGENAVPVLDWIVSLEPKAQVKCLARIKRLQKHGHELRRPEADYLRDDIYEPGFATEESITGFSIFSTADGWLFWPTAL